MRKLVYYVGVSLDGRIAGPGGEFDFYPFGDEKQTAEYHTWMTKALPDTIPAAAREPFGLADTPLQRFDTVLMGRGSYEPGLAEGWVDPYAHLRQYVVSTTVPENPDAQVTLVRRDPVGLVRALKREDADKDIWLCGGGNLAGQLLPEIDELIIKSYPVVAGAGVSAFEGAFDPTVFAVTDRKTFDNGVVVSWLARR
ncbi:dihydrofolate reductase [Streptomyces sp. 3MP-14]|uniref:Dihydrofolate reductase n=1 Tax=Streptomyces mimosae TaxID=2586635 RepID=A0A5N5ZVY4_9ACTN|nr:MULTISPECIES: dihydrofolate reductase family protein [Streptomyces]KAB8159520.1 dihydrofolate reductase [Streptomyces mimosae]KAB8172798.1 dihydrofolate reductase [Streptomyces sp. 3MP-14]